MRILIVDDNRRVRALLRICLKNIPAEFFEASNGKQGVDLYAQCHPDAVLMDVRMPLMDGIEATLCITRLDPEAHVIIVTDYDGLDLREQARRAGAREYVLKEDLEKLPAQLKKLFREENRSNQ
jgi:DNA-binding NarL/FixJ family response regulator